MCVCVCVCVCVVHVCVCAHNKIVPLYTLVWGSLRLAPITQDFLSPRKQCAYSCSCVQLCVHFILAQESVPAAVPAPLNYPRKIIITKYIVRHRI